MLLQKQLGLWMHPSVPEASRLTSILFSSILGYTMHCYHVYCIGDALKWPQLCRNIIETLAHGLQYLGHPVVKSYNYDEVNSLTFYALLSHTPLMHFFFETTHYSYLHQRFQRSYLSFMLLLT